MLTDHDIKKRFEFAKTFRGKPASFWPKAVHLIIDLKNFPVYLNAKGRKHAAQREVRGVYRMKGEGLHRGYTKSSKSAHHNTGATRAWIAAGLGAENVLFVAPR